MTQNEVPNVRSVVNLVRVPSKQVSNPHDVNDASCWNRTMSGWSTDGQCLRTGHVLLGAQRPRRRLCPATSGASRLLPKMLVAPCAVTGGRSIRGHFGCDEEDADTRTMFTRCCDRDGDRLQRRALLHRDVHTLEGEVRHGEARKMTTFTWHTLSTPTLMWRKTCSSGCKDVFSCLFMRSVTTLMLSKPMSGHASHAHSHVARISRRNDMRRSKERVFNSTVTQSERSTKRALTFAVSLLLVPSVWPPMTCATCSAHVSSFRPQLQNCFRP